MFNNQFFPTPENIIAQMLQDENLQGKTILEPSAGSGNMVKYCLERGAKVIACEKDTQLQKLLSGLCPLLSDDFMKVTAAQVSHIDLIVMNPPFNADERHILHAFDIAPPGCKIVALCNLATVTNADKYAHRRQLKTAIEESGHFQDLGTAFDNAERKTGVSVAMVHLRKAGSGYESEFEGFFMDEEPGQAEGQQSGLMSYNVVRDLVHRYIEAVKVFDETLETGIRLSGIIAPFHNNAIGFQCTKEGYQQNRTQFKKDLQKTAWAYIFKKMDMGKIATEGLKADINKFVETQSAIPFTMKNIFRMLEIVIGTTGQRMDKAIEEVFDRLTKHYDENRYSVEGWKTNSHYLLGQKFILPNMCPTDKWNTGPKINTNYGGYFHLMEDLIKAMCHLTGDDYNKFISLHNHIRYEYKLKDAQGNYLSGYHDMFSKFEDANRRRDELRNAHGQIVEIEQLLPTYGEWFDWAYFRCKAFKKGTIHFEFKDEELWARLNQRIAKIKGYPLFENTKKEAEKKEREDNARQQAHTQPRPGTGKVLFTINKPAAATN